MFPEGIGQLVSYTAGFSLVIAQTLTAVLHHETMFPIPRMSAAVSANAFRHSIYRTKYKYL